MIAYEFQPFWNYKYNNLSNNVFFVSVLFREKSEKKLVRPLPDGETASVLDSSGSLKGDILRRHHESKIPSPVIRKGHTLGGQKLSHKEQHHSKQKDCGFEGQSNCNVLEHEKTELFVKSDAVWSRTLDPHQSSYKRHDRISRCMVDCDNLSSEMYRNRTFSDGSRTKGSDAIQSKESQSKIPRNRTNSLDHSIKRQPKRSHQSWHHSLTSAVDSAYSSAPNTPILRRNTAKDRSIRLPSEGITQDPSCLHSSNLAAMYPHLAGVKTAHIRSLSQAISRSAPASPAAIPRITPAARSSIHAHPRAGKPPRLRQKGVEASLTDPYQSQVFSLYELIMNNLQVYDIFIGRILVVHKSRSSNLSYMCVLFLCMYYRFWFTYIQLNCLTSSTHSPLS